MALLRSLGSRYMQRDPSGFGGYVLLDIHSIGSVDRGDNSLVKDIL